MLLRMAGFHVLGITPTFPQPQQPTSHHFHAHRQQTPQSRSSPSSIESLDALSTSGSASGYRASAKSHSFSAINEPSSSIDDFRHPELTSGPPRRRHSDDSSIYLRSEWVTLSKAMLMVLVEKICQLSFENEVPITTSGTEPVTDAETTSRDFFKCLDDTGTGKPDQREADVGDNSKMSNLTGSSLDPALPCLHSFTSSVPDSNSHAPLPAPPSLSASAAAAANTYSTETHKNASTAASVAKEESMTTDAENSWKAKSVLLKTSKTASFDRKFFRKRGSRRILSMPGKSTKSSANNSAAGKDDAVKKLKGRPLRPRNNDRNVQSWIACNKTLVYSMIDNALTSNTEAGVRKVVVVPPCSTVAPQTDGDIRSATTCDDITTTTEDSSNATTDHSSNILSGGLNRKSLSYPDAVRDAPLLGALLSNDDVTTRSDSQQRPHPNRLHCTSCSDRFSNLDSRVSLSPASVTKEDLGSKRHRIFSDELPVSYFRQTPGHQIPSSASTQVFVITDTDYGSNTTSGVLSPRSRDICSPMTAAGSRKKCSTSRDSLRSGSDRQSSVEERGNTYRCSRRGRLGSEDERSIHSGTVARTSKSDPSRPRWIALDKSEVRSLVDSLVSTMMTDGDVACPNVTKCRGILSSTNAVSHDNDDIGDFLLRFGRHCQNEGDSLDSGCDANPVDYRLNTAFSRHGGDRHEEGGHGNGRVECGQKQDVQCLSFDAVQRSDNYATRQAVESDFLTNSNACLSSQEAKIEGSKCSMKWKSTMMLRLHSQSQDG